MGSAAGATVLLTVAPCGAGPLVKKAQWRGSVPDTRATWPGPKNLRGALTELISKGKSLKNAWKEREKERLLPVTDETLNGCLDWSQSPSEDSAPNGPLLLSTR